MKPELQRIEATLNQLANLKAASPAPVKPEARPYKLPPLVTPRSQLRSAQISDPTAAVAPKVLALPPFNPTRTENSRQDSTPVVYLLREIEAIAINWQDELTQVLQDVTQIYDEGPIVDGWLESHPHTATGETTKLRHVDVAQLMDYVEEICNLPDASVSCQSPRDGYRLCGLDEDGKFWSRPCPPEQIPSVSVAIARYHRLKQLLERQQFLETRLNQLTETLGALHHHLQA